MHEAGLGFGSSLASRSEGSDGQMLVAPCGVQEFRLCSFGFRTDSLCILPAPAISLAAVCDDVTTECQPLDCNEMSR